MIRSQTHQLDETYDRLLVVSDIHGHVLPIKQFDELRQAFGERSRIVFNGDLFSGGARPVEVTRWVRENAGDLATIGNHDEVMLQGADGDQPPYTEPGAYQRLDEEQRDYFRRLPHRLVLLWRGKRIVLMHGHLTPSGGPGSWQAVPDEQITNFADADADLCIVSHTHYAFVRRNIGRIFANSGTMCAPILGVQREDRLHVQSGAKALDPDEDRRCSFLAVSESGGHLEVQIIRFDYDRQAALQDMERAGNPSMAYFRKWLFEGILDMTQ